MRTVATLVAVCAAVAGFAVGCGDDEEPAADGARNYTLAEIIERPPVPGQTVGVVGEATPLEDFGFVLSGEGGAIVVRGGADRVEPGEEVRVVGTVDRITQPLSTRIANELEGTPDTTARTNSGALYLRFERLEPPA